MSMLGQTLWSGTPPQGYREYRRERAARFAMGLAALRAARPIPKRPCNVLIPSDGVIREAIEYPRGLHRRRPVSGDPEVSGLRRSTR